MRNVLTQALGAAVLVAIGIVAGWLGTRSSTGPEPPATGASAPHDEHDGHDHGEHAEDEHAGHDHAEGEEHDDAASALPQGVTLPGGAGLSPQALANLGVRVERVAPRDFVETVRVQATVEDAPLNTRPAITELGGVVLELHVRPGQRVAAGDPLVSLARAAIPRPDLVLTGSLLPSLSEELHDAVSAYRNAETQIAIVRRELERVRRFTETGTDEGLPVLPRQTQIDLEYDLARAEQDLANARREVARHGISAEELVGLEDAREVGNDRLWRNALSANGFWSEHQDAVLAALPEALRRVPWIVGALGELAAAGRGGPELAEAVAAEPRLRDRFVEALSLLLAGHSVERVRLLAAAGELEPVVVVRAPGGAPDWDVDSLAARPGQRLEGGTPLVTLHDARTMWLRVEPIGEEVGAVTRAFEQRTLLHGETLLENAGPRLGGLVIDRLVTRGGGHERGTAAYVVCDNAPLVSGPSGTARTWALREGLQYVLRVPVRRLERRFVLPAASLVQRGLERVVLVRDGDAFRAQPVHVEHEDEEVAVIAADGALAEGDEVVVAGAFALGLGLQGSAGADPHAGHDHD